MGFQFNRLWATNLYEWHSELSHLGPHDRVVHGYDLIDMYTHHVYLYVPTFRRNDILPSKLNNYKVYYYNIICWRKKLYELIL